MENPTTIETLIEKAENYTRTSIELAKLNAVDKSADLLSSAVSAIAIFVVVGMFLMLANIGVAFWIGQMLNNIAYGFFSVAAFWVVVAIVLFLFKDQLIKLPISDRIITGLLTPKKR